MVLVAFDSTQRNRQALEDLNASLADHTGDIQAGDSTKYDPRRESLPDNLDQRFHRVRAFHDRLRRTELYPDLALPRYRELKQWLIDIASDKVWDWKANKPFKKYSYLDPANGGTGWQWNANPEHARPGVLPLPQNFRNLPLPGTKRDGQVDASLDLRFADPDFYCAPCQDWGAAAVNKMLDRVMRPQNPSGKDHETQLADPYGGTLNIRPGIPLEQAIQDRQRINDTLDQQLKRGTQALTNGEVQGIGSSPFASNTPTDTNSRGILPGQQQGATGSGIRNPSGTMPSAGSLRLAAPNKAAETRMSLEERYQHYAPQAIQIANSVGLDPALFLAVLRQESAFNNWAGSSAGARGLGQLVGKTNQPNDPVTNMTVAARYLKAQIDTFGSVELGLAAYNAGPGAVRKYHNQVPPYKETQQYIYGDPKNTDRKPGILRYWAYYRNHMGADPRQQLNRAQMSALDQQTEVAYDHLIQMFNRGYGFPYNMNAIDDGSGKPHLFIKKEFGRAAPWRLHV